MGQSRTHFPSFRGVREPRPPYLPKMGGPGRFGPISGIGHRGNPRYSLTGLERPSRELAPSGRPRSECMPGIFALPCRTSFHFRCRHRNVHSSVLLAWTATTANRAFQFKRSTSFLGIFYVGHADNMKKIRGSILDDGVIETIADASSTR
jgi:hypothetical protein